MSVGGDTLSGAASGAALGSVAGPWGTLAGAVGGAAVGLVSGLSKKKKRDDAAKKVNRPTYQVPQEAFQNKAMYEAMANSQRVPGQSYIENQIAQQQAQALAASQQVAGSSADAQAAVGRIQQNSLNAYGELGAMAAQNQAANIDKLAQARSNVADYRQQAFDYNQNEPYKIAFAQSQKLQDQNQLDNQNITNDVQALAMMGGQFTGTGTKTKRKTVGKTSNASSPTYNYQSYSDLNLA
jgi:hypothetical protein